MQQQPHNNGYRMQTPAYGSAGFVNPASGFPTQAGPNLGQPMVIFAPQFVPQAGYSTGVPFASINNQLIDQSQTSGAARHTDMTNGPRSQYSTQTNRGWNQGGKPAAQQNHPASIQAVIMPNGGFTVPVVPTGSISGQPNSVVQFPRGGMGQGGAMQFPHSSTTGLTAGGVPQGAGIDTTQGSATHYHPTMIQPMPTQYFDPNLYTPSMNMGSAAGAGSNAGAVNQQPAQKRERKPLMIVDPKTDTALDLAHISASASNSATNHSSERADVKTDGTQVTASASEESVVPKQSNDVAAQFAAQVAATLTPAGSGAASSKQVVHENTQGLPVASSNRIPDHSISQSNDIPKIDNTELLASSSSHAPVTSTVEPKVEIVSNVVHTDASSASAVVSDKKVESSTSEMTEPVVSSASSWSQALGKTSAPKNEAALATSTAPVSNTTPISTTAVKPAAAAQTSKSQPTGKTDTIQATPDIVTPSVTAKTESVIDTTTTTSVVVDAPISTSITNTESAANSDTTTTQVPTITSAISTTTVSSSSAAATTTTQSSKTQSAQPSGTISYSAILRTSAPAFQPSASTVRHETEVSKTEVGKVAPGERGVKETTPSSGCESSRASSGPAPKSGEGEEDGWIESKVSKKNKKHQKGKEPVVGASVPRGGGSSAAASNRTINDMDALTDKAATDEQHGTKHTTAELNGVSETSASEKRSEFVKPSNPKNRETSGTNARSETKSVERNWSTNQADNGRGRKGQGSGGAVREQSADSARKEAQQPKPPAAAAVPAKPPPVWVPGKQSTAIFSAKPAAVPEKKPTPPPADTTKKPEPQPSNKPGDNRRGKDGGKMERASAERTVSAPVSAPSVPAPAAAAAAPAAAAAAPAPAPSGPVKGSYAASLTAAPVQEAPQQQKDTAKVEKPTGKWNKESTKPAQSTTAAANAQTAPSTTTATEPKGFSYASVLSSANSTPVDSKAAATKPADKPTEKVSIENKPVEKSKIVEKIPAEPKHNTRENLEIKKSEQNTKEISSSVDEEPVSEKLAEDNVVDTTFDKINEKEIVNKAEITEPVVQKKETTEEVKEPEIKSTEVKSVESKPVIEEKTVKEEKIDVKITESSSVDASEENLNVKEKIDVTTSQRTVSQDTKQTENKSATADVPNVEDKSTTEVSESQKVEDKVEEKNVALEEESKTPEEEVSTLDNETNEEEESKTETPKPASLLYNYAEDQWSPLNPEGKKQYDRSFLLTLQFTNKAKPAFQLPQLDCVLAEPRTSSSKSSESSQGRYTPVDPMSPIDFTPGYVKSTPSGSRSAKRGGSMRRDGPMSRDPRSGPPDPNRKVISVTLAADIKLHTTENAWKANPTMYKGGQDLATEDLYKRMRGILNKLTPQKFETLLNQVKTLPIDSAERLEGCINIIFEKAISEPNFSVAYAHMAKRLMTVNVPTEGNPEEKVSFRKLLLNKCQQEFEKDKEEETDIEQMQRAIDEAQPDKKAQLIEERDLAIAKAKRRSLGLIRFIGELFKLKMLTEKIMHECLQKLLRNDKDEDSLECLCQLLTTIGQEIDAKGTQSSKYLDSYMKKLIELVDQKLVCARIRFMILDVNDLRKNEWVPRREKNNPKTIEEIHREAQEEEMNKQIQIQRAQQEQRSQQQQQRGPHQRGLPPQHNVRPMAANDDGWTNVSKAPRATVDPSKMKFSKLDDNISLGPGGRPGASWIKGSSGGSSSNAAANKESDRPTVANRYSALAANEDSRGRGGRMSPAHGGPGGSASADYRGRHSGPYNMERGGQSRPSQERNSSRDQRRGGPGSGLAPGSRSGQTSPYNSRSASREANPRGPPAGMSMSTGRDMDLLAPSYMTRPSAPAQSSGVESSRKAAPAVSDESLKDDEGVKDEKKIETKSKSTMDEYLHIRDLKEATECVKEISRSCRNQFIYHSISSSLERSDAQRESTGALHAHLLEHGVVSSSQYVTGLKEIIDLSEELVIDIANYWKCLASLITPVTLVSSDPVTLTALRSSWDVLTAEQIGHLIMLILSKATKSTREDDVRRLWQESRLNWSDFYSSADTVKGLLAEHKLEFLSESSSSGHETSRSVESSIERLSYDLKHLLKNNPQTSNDIICDTIEKSLDSSAVSSIPFICALFTCISDHCIIGSSDKMSVDNKMLKERLSLFKKYVCTPEHELNALYSLQALLTKLQHPPDVLRCFFIELYDDDIISEETFYTWRDSTDPAHQHGKGVALTSVNQFFTFLAEQPANDS